MNSDKVRGNCVNIFLIGAPIARTESSLDLTLSYLVKLALEGRKQAPASP